MSELGKEITDKLEKQRSVKIPFRISLRYKLALPVLILVIFLLSLLFRTTFRTVRAVVMERNQTRLQSIAEVFAESIKVPLLLRNQEVLLANIQWMSQRPEVREVRVEDSEGIVIGGGADPSTMTLLSSLEKDFYGVRHFAGDTYAAVAPIQNEDEKIGRVQILFSQEGFEAELRYLFVQRLMLAFTMGLMLAGMISLLTWLAIRPIFNLKKTAQQILAGDLTARAQIFSFDEIQDLADAFNEMVERLAKSLDNLRTRTEALEESEEKYRHIVESSTDIIFTLTPEGELALVNKDISGHNREELIMEGMWLFLKLLTPESRARFDEALERVCQTKQSMINLSVEHVHKENQKPIFYLLNLTPMMDHEGNVKFIQGVMRDVTELRRIEMMKDSLIRDVAHELKTPTAKFEMALEWFGKELEKNNEKGKYDQILTIMKTNAQRLMRTIVSIMDMTKLESGMSKAMFEMLDIHEVLQMVFQDMEPLCAQKGLKLEKDFAGQPLKMRGDRDMLYRLFVNIIGNATKFTEAGSIKIKTQKSLGNIAIAISDTGIGLEKGDQEKIFERFYQKTAASVGIGVGLAISRDIVRRHNGRIWVESEGAGKGSIFKVEFPVEVI